MRFKAQDFSLGLRVHVLGFRVQGLVLRCYGLGFGAS